MTQRRIDVHAHYLPEFYRQALAENGQSRPDGMPKIPEWSEASALQTMDTLGVQTAMLSISSPGVHFGDDGAARALAARLNDEGARLKRQNPNRFGFFAVTPLPDVDGAVRALDRLDADGVTLETNFHGVYLGDEKLEPLYRELNARRAVVFLHPTSPSCPCCESLALGYPRPMLEFMFETTRSVSQMILSGVLQRFPDLRIVVPHAGAALPVLASRIESQHALLQGTSADETLAANFKSEMAKLYYDLAGAPCRSCWVRCCKSPAPTTCSTAATGRSRPPKAAPRSPKSSTRRRCSPGIYAPRRCAAMLYFCSRAWQAERRFS